MTVKHTNSRSCDSRLGKVIAGYIQAVEAGEQPDRTTLLAAYPELASELTEFFADQDNFERLLLPFRRLEQLPATDTLDMASANVPNSGANVPRRFGDYELIEEIAHGGMGIVFKARNRLLDRIVALKMILSGHFATSIEVERFHLEAENAARLDHPHIVPVYEVGERDGQHFFTMRLIEGKNLSGHMARFVNDSGSAVRLVAKVARAVHYAHQRGILHRDLKPANILLDGSGEPYVTDFGLARRLVDASASSTAVVGTPSYMAPEQASGKAVLSTAADVFSLGAILYELLTGRVPFRADTPFDTLIRVVEQEPPRPRALNPRLDRDLETICLKCLEKSPERRYGSAEAMAEDLERWMAGRPIDARHVGALERAFKWARRRPAAAALVTVSTVAVLTILTGLFFGYLAITEEKSRADVALEKHKSALRGEQLALREARQNAYYQTIALASPEVRANDVRRAERLLDSCAPEFRRWEWFALKRLCHAEMVSHELESEPSAFDFSPDGKLLAVAAGPLGESGTISIRDTADGRALASFRGHEDAIQGLAFGPAGKWLATAGRDRVIGIWDVATTKLDFSLRGHVRGVNAVTFSPNGTYVASAGEDGMVKIWDVALRRECRSFSGHTGSVLVVAFDPRGKLLASAGVDGTIRVWDLVDESKSRTFHGHGGPVRGLDFSPDGQILASAAYDGTARLWDVETGTERLVHRGHTRFVTGVAFSPIGPNVASSSLDGTIQVWDINSGHISKTSRGHAGGVWGVGFRADGRCLASIGEDQSLKLWDTSSLALDADLHAPTRPAIRQLTLAGNGRMLATVRMADEPNGQQALEVWDISSGRSLLSYDRLAASDPVALSSDGRTLVCAGGSVGDSSIRVLRVDSGQVIGELKWRGSQPSIVTLSPDGTRLAAVTRDDGAFLWNVNTDPPVVLREDREPHEGGSGSSLRALFAPDGATLVLADPTFAAEALTVFDAATGNPLAGIPGATTPLAFNGDGRLLLALDSEGSGRIARIFVATEGREIARLEGHTGPIVSAAFGDGGDRIATASLDGTVKVWNATGRELMTLPSEGRVPTQLQFDSDNQRLVGIDDRGSLLIWEAGPFSNPRGLEKPSSKH